MSWKGKEEVEKALRSLESSKGRSGSRIRNATHVALKCVKEYKRVVHAIEHFIWKKQPEYRLAGLYLIDSILRQASGKQSVYIARFLQHMSQTLQSVQELPPDEQNEVYRIVGSWQTEGFYTPEEIAGVGGQKYCVTNSTSTGEGKAGNPEGSPPTTDADKFTSLLTILKKRKELASTTSKPAAPSNPTQHQMIDAGVSSMLASQRESSSRSFGSTDDRNLRQSNTMNRTEHDTRSNYNSNYRTMDRTGGEVHHPAYPSAEPDNFNGPGGLLQAPGRAPEPLQRPRDYHPNDRWNREPSPHYRQDTRDQRYGPPGHHSDGRYPARGYETQQYPQESPRFARDRESTREICIKFQAGGCKRGDTCKYEHIPGGRSDPKKPWDILRNTKMCTNLPNCRFGDKCHFAHDQKHLVTLDRQTIVDYKKQIEEENGPAEGSYPPQRGHSDRTEPSQSPMGSSNFGMLGNRPPMDRPPMDRPPIDRHRTDRPLMDRPPTGPPMNRHHDGPSMGPIIGNPPMRPPMNRPPGDRPFMGNPPMNMPMHRPPTNQPVMDGRPQGPPMFNRPPSDRPLMEHSYNGGSNRPLEDRSRGETRGDNMNSMGRNLGVPKTTSRWGAKPGATDTPQGDTASKVDEFGRIRAPAAAPEATVSAHVAEPGLGAKISNDNGTSKEVRDEDDKVSAPVFSLQYDDESEDEDPANDSAPPVKRLKSDPTSLL